MKNFKIKKAALLLSALMFAGGVAAKATPVDTRFDLGYGYTKTTFYDGEGFYADYRYQMLRDVILTAHYTKVDDDDLEADGTRIGASIEKVWSYNPYTDIGIELSYTHDDLSGNGYDETRGIVGLGVGYHSFVGAWRFDGSVSINDAEVEDTFIEGEFRATYFLGENFGLTLQVVGGEIQNAARLGMTYQF